MKTLDQIKESYATDHEYLSWEELVADSTSQELGQHTLAVETEFNSQSKT